MAASDRLDCRNRPISDPLAKYSKKALVAIDDGGQLVDKMANKLVTVLDVTAFSDHDSKLTAFLGRLLEFDLCALEIAENNRLFVDNLARKLVKSSAKYALIAVFSLRLTNRSVFSEQSYKLYASYMLRKTVHFHCWITHPHQNEPYYFTSYCRIVQYLHVCMHLFVYSSILKSRQKKEWENAMSTQYLGPVM